jgi:Ca2+-binding RTX toxin-like protein
MATKEVNLLNNILDGTDSDDTLLGDWRDNVIFGHGGDDLIIGDGGKDTIGGGADDDEVFGQSGDDRLFGDTGDDILHGGADNDELYGGANNDELRGGKGSDELFGGAGDDTIIDTEGADIIDGGGDNDTIEVQGGDAYRFDRVSGGSGHDDITVLGAKMLVSAGSGNDTITTDVRPDKVVGGNSGSDRFILTEFTSGTGRVAELFGGDATVEQDSILFQGERILSTTAGADTSVDTLDLSQLEGFDASAFAPTPDVGFVDRVKVDLSQGHLISFSGEVGFGTTPFTPSPGFDGLQERLFARLFGIENVVGSDGGDTLIGNGVANDFRAGGGADDVRGGGGNDHLEGGAGDDEVRGDVGDDTILGGDNADKLFGGAGIDTIDGGAGIDIIHGDNLGEAISADILTGGSGADTFVFADVGKTLAGVYNSNPFNGPSFQFVEVSVTDTITDFQTGSLPTKGGSLVISPTRDTIDLAQILDAKSNFAGTTAQQAINQGYIYFVQHGTAGQEGFGTTVMVDLNGGAHNDAANNFGVVELSGVRASELGSWHFLV